MRICGGGVGGSGDDPRSVALLLVWQQVRNIVIHAIILVSFLLLIISIFQISNLTLEFEYSTF